MQNPNLVKGAYIPNKSAYLGHLRCVQCLIGSSGFVGHLPNRLWSADHLIAVRSHLKVKLGGRID